MPPRTGVRYRPKIRSIVNIANLRPNPVAWGGGAAVATAPVGSDDRPGKKKKKPPQEVSQPAPPTGGGNKGGGNKGGGNKGGGGKNWWDKAEKGGGAPGEIVPPALDPLDALKNSEGHRQLYTSFRDQVALLAQQQRIANARKNEDLMRNQQSRFAELQSFAGASNERGTLGSSMDFTGRMGIRDQFLSQAQAVRNAWSEGKLGNIAQRMQARRDYETGVLQLKMNKAAQQAMDEIYDEITNDDDSAGGGGGGGGGGGDVPGGKGPPGKGGDKGGKKGSKQRYHEKWWETHQKLKGKSDKQLARRRRRNRQDIRELRAQVRNTTNPAIAENLLEQIAKEKKRNRVLRQAARKNDPKKKKKAKGGKSTKGGPVQ